MPSWNASTNSATRCAPVVNASALTAVASFSATYTPAEVNALRADVLALQAKINALLVTLRADQII